MSWRWDRATAQPLLWTWTCDCGQLISPPWAAGSSL
jgi:hypothetical protein